MYEQTEVVESEIGEDFNPEIEDSLDDEQQNQSTDTDESDESEGSESTEDEQQDEDTPKTFTAEEKAELIKQAEKFYGVKKDQVVVDKNGNLKLVVKINGKNRLINPQTDMLKGFNLSQAGYEKLNEGKQLVKQVREFFNEAKSNPNKMWEIADNLGIDKYELAKQLLQEKIEDHELTDEQKELKKLKQRENDWKKREDEEKKQIELAKHNEAKQKELQRYDQELTQAMLKHGFKKSSETTKSHVLLSAIGELMVAQKTGVSLSCEDAVQRAKQKWQDHIQDFYGDIEDDQILNIVPKKIIERIRKADLNKLNLVTPTSNSQGDIGQQVNLEEYQDDIPRKKSKQKMSMNDFFNSLKSL